MRHVGVTGDQPAATTGHGGARRTCARGIGSMRQGHQEVARARAHLGEPTEGAGVAGISNGGERGGGRSSGEVGFGVRGHGREASGGYGLLETC